MTKKHIRKCPHCDVPIHSVSDDGFCEQCQWGEIIIPLRNGGTIRCGTGEFDAHGSYIRICDLEGIELAYWDKEEWKEEPEQVIGDIFRLASIPTIEEIKNKLNRTKIVGDHWE